MLNLYDFKGFALNRFDNSYEANRLVPYSFIKDIRLIRVDAKSIMCPKDYVPCGSVEWCLKSLLKKVVPDPYPEWIKDHLYRNTWSTEVFPYNKRVFIKPLLDYKRFNGFITTGKGFKGKKRGPYQCSDVVSFTNEWRYYITNGEVVDSGWYWGDDINTPDAPEFPKIDFPYGWCGTVDMGTLPGGELAVVECHHPFACGMYSKNDEAYFQWLVDGWKYMQSRYS